MSRQNYISKEPGLRVSDKELTMTLGKPVQIALQDCAKQDSTLAKIMSVLIADVAEPSADSETTTRALQAPQPGAQAQPQDAADEICDVNGVYSFYTTETHGLPGDERYVAFCMDDSPDERGRDSRTDLLLTAADARKLAQRLLYSADAAEAPDPSPLTQGQLDRIERECARKAHGRRPNRGKGKKRRRQAKPGGAVTYKRLLSQ